LFVFSLFLIFLIFNFVFVLEFFYQIHLKNLMGHTVLFPIFLHVSSEKKTYTHFFREVKQALSTFVITIMKRF